MKTVMKKMFSLLLVAVMLVSVMPFQAFADDTLVGVRFFADETNIGSAYGAVATTTVGGTIASAPISPNANFKHWVVLSQAADGATKTSTIFTLGETAVTQSTWVVAEYYTCTGAADCIYAPHDSDCDSLKCTYGCGAAKHEGACCDLCDGNGHQESACDNYCTDCQEVGHVATADHCNTCHKYNTHTDTCTDECTNNGDCAWNKAHLPNCVKVQKCLYCQVTGDHYSADCPTYYTCCNSVKTSGHKTTCENYDPPVCTTCGETGHEATACRYCTECLKKGDKNTSHTANAHCSVCHVANGHATNCSNVTYPATGNSKLYVWANLIVGNSEKETILLDTITGLSGSDLTYQVVARNEARLRSKIPNGYSWTGHVYFEQDPETAIKVSSTMTISDDDDVVINLYTDQKLVVARIHTSKSFTVDRLVDVGGFQIGDTITSNDVLKAVKKHYSVSSMKMYTPGDWETIVQGGSASVLPNFKVVGGDNIVDVYLVGSRISSSSTSYTADSSNPKTGDTIFAPIAIMGLSVSALAVLFYLNKKRAC